MSTPASEIAAALRKKEFRYDNERDLQDGIERALAEGKFTYERERRLGDAGVADFLVSSSVCLEVKVEGAPAMVARQLLRYAGRPEVLEILLVTGRAALGRLPPTLRGKPVTVLALWRSLL